MIQASPSNTLFNLSTSYPSLVVSNPLVREVNQAATAALQCEREFSRFYTDIDERSSVVQDIEE